MNDPKPATGQLSTLETRFIHTAKKRDQSVYSNEQIIRIIGRLKSEQPNTERELERLNQII